MKRLLFAFSIAVVAIAQSTLAPPALGFVRDNGGALRPVLGLAGNFILGDPIVSNVSSTAFSGSFGFAKTSGALIIFDARGRTILSSDAPPGPALFAFSRTGQQGLVFYPQSGALLSWNNGALADLALDSASLGGKALSIAFTDANHIMFLVDRGELWAVRIALDSGEPDLQFSIHGVSAPVLMLANGNMLLSTSKGLVMRSAKGIEEHLDVLPLVNSTLNPMGDGWIHLLAPPGQPQFALQLSGRRMYQLPEAAQ